MQCFIVFALHISTVLLSSVITMSQTSEIFTIYISRGDPKYIIIYLAQCLSLYYDDYNKSMIMMTVLLCE